MNSEFKKKVCNFSKTKDKYKFILYNKNGNLHSRRDVDEDNLNSILNRLNKKNYIIYEDLELLTKEKIEWIASKYRKRPFYIKNNLLELNSKCPIVKLDINPLEIRIKTGEIFCEKINFGEFEVIMEEVRRPRIYGGKFLFSKRNLTRHMHVYKSSYSRSNTSTLCLGQYQQTYLNAFSRGDFTEASNIIRNCLCDASTNEGIQVNNQHIRYYFIRCSLCDDLLEGNYDDLGRLKRDGVYFCEFCFNQSLEI